jgi:transcriptional regulator with XRE-family HTH domain
MKTIIRGQITEIANKTGSAVSTISEIFSGKKRPSPQLAKKLEAATGIGRFHWLYPAEYPNPFILGGKKK